MFVVAVLFLCVVCLSARVFIMYVGLLLWCVCVCCLCVCSFIVVLVCVVLGCLCVGVLGFMFACDRLLVFLRSCFCFWCVLFVIVCFCLFFFLFLLFWGGDYCFCSVVCVLFCLVRV